MPRLDLGLPGLFCLLILPGFSGLEVAPRRYSAIVRVSDASIKQRNKTMIISTHNNTAYTVTKTEDGQFRAAFKDSQGNLVTVTHKLRRVAVACIKSHIED